MRLVVGIPSFNEVDSISRVATDCAQKMQELMRPDQFVLLHCDSGSTDGTVQAFKQLSLGVATASRHHDLPGKGRNVREMAKFVVEQDCDGLIICDTDLAEVRASWFASVIAGLQAGNDAVFARRPPLFNRGDLTYHLCYPAIAASYGMRVREPIAPTQAYSRSLLERALAMAWDEDTLNYGVDFALATLAHDMRWTEAVMPELLIHKLRSFATDDEPGLSRGAKFAQVLRTVRRLALQAPDRCGSPSQSMLGDPSELVFASACADADYERLACKVAAALEDGTILSRCPPQVAGALRETLHCGPFKGLPWPIWRDCLLEWTHSDVPLLTVEDMEVLLLARCAGFYFEALECPDWYSIVEAQVDDFCRHWPRS
jgi:Glycosyl transferase family 2